MIKINITNEAKVKADFWDMVNPILKKRDISKNRIYQTTSILYKIDQKINTFINNNKWKEVKFFSFIEELIESKELIIANPERLSELKGKIERQLRIFNNNEKESINTNLREIFDYDNWVQRKFNNENNGNYLAQQLQINTCPYCNRAYTFTISKGEKSIVRPEFDHFFDKSTYPYLALSLYNLVPSCHSCNHIKHKKEFKLSTHFHPYREGFDNELRFTICIDNVNFVANSKDFKIGLKRYFVSKNKYKKAKRNLNDFELWKLYDYHKDYVQELIWKSKVYSDSYIKDLFQQYEGSLFSDISDVKRLITGNYTELEDLIKRPLSKLTHDIAEELGLLP